MATPETNPTSLRPRRLHLAALVGSLALGLLHGSDLRPASFTVTTTADAQGACTPIPSPPLTAQAPPSLAWMARCFMGM